MIKEEREELERKYETLICQIKEVLNEQAANTAPCRIIGNQVDWYGDKMAELIYKRQCERLSQLRAEAFPIGNILQQNELPKPIREYVPQVLSYAEYLRSPAWKSKRDEAIEHADRRCQLCNSDERLNVHHRTYERLGSELPTDLIVLCKDCHAKFHDKLP